MTDASSVVKPLALFYLTIIHQNDIHSHFGFISSYGYKCLKPREKCYGGFSTAVHWVKDRIKNDKYSKNLLNVNSGDFFKGNQYYSVFKWRLVADMINHMPYTALSLGDAEFADGTEELLLFLQAVGEKFICTNINFTASFTGDMLRQLCPRHRIIPYQDGTRHVCLLSYTTPTAAKLMSDGGPVFENEEEALTREIKYVRNNRPDVKIFVALGHSGYERDKEIAHRVPSLDVIVGGHSHTLLWPNLRNKMMPGTPDDPRDKQFAKGVYPTVVIQPSGRTVLIGQMYKHGKYMGVLNVTFNADDEVVDFFTSPVLLTGTMKSDTETEKALDVYRQKMKKLQQKPIGSTRVELKGDFATCSHGECNLGNLVTDSVLWYMRYDAVRTPRTQVAIINAGAIKVDIMPGKLKMADISQALPYPDTVDIVELRGETIRKLLEHSLKDPIFSHSFLQMSGMRVRYNISQPEGQRVESVRILCQSCVSPRFEPLVDSAIYNVAMFTYIAVGNDGFTMIKQEMVSSHRRHDVSIDIFSDYVRHFTPLYPYIDGRIEVVSAPTMNNTAISTLRWQGSWTAVAAAEILALPMVVLMSQLML